MQSNSPPSASLAAQLEALLFVADGPVTLDDLARALGCTREEVGQGVEELIGASTDRGVRVVRSGSRVQLVTAPETAPSVGRFLGITASGRLSTAALETLSIIAYRQPVTRAQVEAIRGVNSDAVIRNLIGKGLVESVGRLEQAGYPELLATTFEFLHYFGIRSLNDLPPLPDVEDTKEDAKPAQTQ